MDAAVATRLAVVGLVGQHAPQGEDGEEGGEGQRAAAGGHDPQHVRRLLRAQIPFRADSQRFYYAAGLFAVLGSAEVGCCPVGKMKVYLMSGAMVMGAISNKASGNASGDSSNLAIMGGSPANGLAASGRC